MSNPVSKQSLLGFVRELETATRTLPDDDALDEHDRINIQAVASRLSAALQSPQEALAKIRFQVIPATCSGLWKQMNVY